MNESILKETNEECWLKRLMRLCILYLDCIYDLLSLSWLVEYKCALSMVASNEYLVWVVVCYGIHTLKKYDLW